MKNEISTGTLLISKPFMEDKRFEKTIILIVEHNNNGSIGLIINKNSLFNAKDIIPEINVSDVNLKEGGPVEKDTLFFIHKHPHLIPNSQKIKDELYFGGDINQLIESLQKKQIKINDIIFFIGYSGWDKKQLEEEIEEGSWITHNINLERIFEKIEWSNILIEFNQDFEVWASAPSDFHLN